MPFSLHLQFPYLPAIFGLKSNPQIVVALTSTSMPDVLVACSDGCPSPRSHSNKPYSKDAVVTAPSCIHKLIHASLLMRRLCSSRGPFPLGCMVPRDMAARCRCRCRESPRRCLCRWWRLRWWRLLWCGYLPPCRLPPDWKLWCIFGWRRDCRINRVNRPCKCWWGHLSRVNRPCKCWWGHHWRKQKGRQPS
jgi:hypothetical protein